MLRLTAALPGQSADVLRTVADLGAAYGLDLDASRELIEEASRAARRGVEADSIKRQLQASAMLAEVSENVDLEQAASPAS